MYCMLYCLLCLSSLNIYLFNVPHSSSADLATTVHNFIIRDPNLHQKVLLYEPIWVEQLHADLKANNLRFKLHQLMDYLDEQVRKNWIFCCL